MRRLASALQTLFIIICRSFHHGKGSAGSNFRDTLPDHHKRMVEPFTMFLKGAFGQYGYLFILNCALILSLAATASPKQVPAENSTDCVDALDSAQTIPSSDHPVYSSSAPAQALPSISIPVTFDRTASIQPNEQLPTTVIPHGGPVDVSFSGHDFDFYSSLNPSFLMDTSGSLPEHSLDLPEDDTALIPEQSHQQMLLPILFRTAQTHPSLHGTRMLILDSSIFFRHLAFVPLHV